MIKHDSAPNTALDQPSLPSFEDMTIRLPSRLRIHQRMGQMPARFQREVGPSIERLSGRGKRREVTAGELVSRLGSIIAGSAFGLEAGATPEPETVAGNRAVEHYMQKTLKQLIDDPVQRERTYSVYAQARLNELHARSPDA